MGRAVSETLPGPRNSDVATENGRFQSVPMCTDLTGECARKFLADLEYPDDRTENGGLPGRGPRSIWLDIASGLVDSPLYTQDEALQMYELEQQRRKGGT